MQPGPTKIKKCSNCSRLIEEETIRSGNTFGATFWSDFKQEAPMLPETPWLVECPHCSAALWLDELETIGENFPWDENKTFKESLAYRVPSFDRYFQLLKNEITNADKEKYLRLRAWWSGNDARRKSESPKPMSEDEIGNLQKFKELLKEADPQELLMIAEILRELGRFEEAAVLLKREFDEDFT